MYTTCIFCMGALGRNEVLEHFPVGRRLAFDAAKGRLWVVCPRCERWNLSPLEERWEAIEQAERRYHDTRLRVSTDHIGLARLREGLELVRIGTPARPEIAAWRYGDQFGRRRRRRILGAGAFVVGGGLVVTGGMMAGVGVWFGFNAGRALWDIAQRGWPGRTIARLRDEQGSPIRVQRRHLRETTIAMGRDGSLALNVAHRGGSSLLQGGEARRAAAVLLPSVNRFGGSKDDVQEAVGRLERAGDAEQFLSQTARRGQRLTRVVRVSNADDVDDSGLLALSTPLSLAIEMAVHEDQERRALEGELEELERAWREAEEVGAIADSLLLPPWVEGALERLRRSGDDRL